MSYPGPNRVNNEFYRYFGVLRVSASDEEDGMDVVKHGESAYPVAAWLEWQYSRDQEPGQVTGAREGFPANMSYPSLTEVTGDTSSEERHSPDRESGDSVKV